MKRSKTEVFNDPENSALRFLLAANSSFGTGEIMIRELAFFVAVELIRGAVTQ